MAINLNLWKENKKILNLTNQDIANEADVSLNTVKNIFRGVTTDPRLETVQRIEKVLGLSPEWTEEDRAQGVGKHAVVLSDEDERRLQLLWQAEETLGSDYVKAYLYALEIAIQQKQLK